MQQPHKNLSKLSYSELHELIARSSILEGPQAEAFASALASIALYQNESRLQVMHSQAVLNRMSNTSSFQEALLLSHIQESVPSFYLSLTLRQLFARGLVVAASKDGSEKVFRRAIARLYEIPSFGSCPALQRCAGELLLDAVAASESQDSATQYLKELKSLNAIAYSPELQNILANAERQAKRVGRDPIVKIDLNQKLAAPVKAVGKLLGMGDFRIKVELRGLEYYDQAVVKVPAFTEKSARKTTQGFLRDFLKKQSGQVDKSAKILDIYPPGSAWESGRHPVLKLE